MSIEPYRGELEQFDPYWLERMYAEWEENEQYLEDDMDYYENEYGGYCEHCDSSFHEDEISVLVDQWAVRYACPVCGHVDPKVYKSDAYYDLGLYLLSIADDDWAWPEYMTPLPKYEG